jgi:hypothetical protein
MSTENQFTMKRFFFNNGWAFFSAVILIIILFTESDTANKIKGAYAESNIESIDRKINSIDDKIEKDLATKEDLKKLELSIQANTDDIRAIETSRAKDIAEIKALINNSTKQQDKILEIIQMQERRTIEFFRDYELKKKEN